MLKFFKFKKEERFVHVKEGLGQSYWLTQDAHREKMLEEQKMKYREYLSCTQMSRPPTHRTYRLHGR